MSCLVGVEVVLIPELLGLDIASVKGCDEFVSTRETFSPLAFEEGRSTFSAAVSCGLGVVDSVPLESLFDSKFIFCEKFESTEFTFGGDCDR